MALTLESECGVFVVIARPLESECVSWALANGNCESDGMDAFIEEES